MDLFNLEKYYFLPDLEAHFKVILYINYIKTTCWCSKCRKRFLNVVFPSLLSSMSWCKLNDTLNDRKNIHGIINRIENLLINIYVLSLQVTSVQFFVDHIFYFAIANLEKHGMLSLVFASCCKIVNKHHWKLELKVGILSHCEFICKT